MTAWIAENLGAILFLAVIAGLFTGFPVAFVLGGVSILVGGLGIALDVFQPVQFFNWLLRIWGGVASNYVLVAAPMFIFMGTVLERSGIANELLDTLQVITRRIPGGLAMSVTLMGTIMAATTGIIGASIVMLSLVALPAMFRQGYQKELSVGTIASAGTLGILIPPSIMLVVMGDLLSVPVGTLFAAAVLPGLLLSLLYLVYIGIVSFVRPDLAPPLLQEGMSQSFMQMLPIVARSLFAPAFLIVLVLGSIFAGWATPTEAAGVGAAGALLIALFKRKLSAKALREMFESAALTNAMVFFIFFGAVLFGYVFRSVGGDDVVAGVLRAFNLHTGWGIVIFMMVLVFILGFFFDWIEITLIVLPLFLPALRSADFSSHIGQGDQVLFMTWFIIMLSVNLQTSFLTPPFGMALFFMKGTVPETVTMVHIYTGIVPFVGLQLLALLLIIAFPNLVLWFPRIMGLLN